jgi:hypothetical protein
MRRAIFRWSIAVAIATGSLVAPSRWSVALEHDSQTASVISQANASCPSREFSAFFKVFSTRSDVQRKFTRFPLDYLRLDAELIGTDKEDQAFKTRLIERFEDIPLFNKGVIFPDEKERKKNELRVEVTTRKNSHSSPDADPERVINDSESATATIFVPDTGFRIHFRFRRDSRCWFLYGISDRSI